MSCNVSTPNPNRFQSPLGEVVKETVEFKFSEDLDCEVSIPSRGSGKGDKVSLLVLDVLQKSFNPLSGKW